MHYIVIVILIIKLKNVSDRYKNVNLQDKLYLNLVFGPVHRYLLINIKQLSKLSLF